MGKTVKRGLVLLGHGARHPEWAAPFAHIRQIAQSRLSDAVVTLAFLEFMQPDLPVAIGELVRQGCSEIVVVPLFLGQSGHVLRDVPPQIERLRQDYPQLSLTTVNAAGDDAAVQAAIAGYCVAALAARD